MRQHVGSIKFALLKSFVAFFAVDSTRAPMNDRSGYRAERAIGPGTWGNMGVAWAALNNSISPPHHRLELKNNNNDNGSRFLSCNKTDEDFFLVAASFTR